MLELVVYLDLGYDGLYDRLQMRYRLSCSNILCNFVSVCDRTHERLLEQEPTSGP